MLARRWWKLISYRNFKKMDPPEWTELSYVTVVIKTAAHTQNDILVLNPVPQGVPAIANLTVCYGVGLS